MLNVGDKVKLRSSNDTWTPEMVKYSEQIVTIRFVRLGMFTISESPTIIFTLDDVDEKVGAPVFEKQELYDIISEIYGEQNVDVIDIDGGFQLNILFKKVDITNSRDVSHKIHDLYVGVQVTGFRMFNEIKGNIRLVGRRGKITYKEKVNSYSHSHLPRGHSNWDNFCLGSSDISMLINELKMSFDRDQWYMLFYALPNYVNWESLEGGPHISIQDMTRQNTLDDDTVYEEWERIKPLLPNNVFDHLESLQLIENHPDLIQFYNEHSNIKSLIQESPDLERINRDITTRFMFKNETIKLTVIEEEVIPQLHVSQEVINKYNEYLKQELKQFNDAYQESKLKQLHHEEVFGQDFIIQ
jgi:hypothetical protein